MKNTYRLVAETFRSRSMVTVAQHDGARLPMGNPHFLPLNWGDDNDKNLKRRDKEARAAVKSVPFQIVANDQQYGVEEYGRPYIPATSLRAKLRNTATDVITEGMTGQLKHQTVALLTVGGRIMKGSVPSSTLAQYAKRDLGLPIFSLFGFNNPEFLKGFDSFSSLVSKGHFMLTLNGSVRQIPYNQNRELLDLLSSTGFKEAEDEELTQRANSAKKSNKTGERNTASKELEKMKKRNASSDEINKQEELVGNLNKDIDNIKEESEVSAAQLHGKWYIPEGVDFDFSLTHRMSQEELGLLLVVLNKFGANPFLGGDKGRGAGGDFEFDFTVEKYNSDTMKFDKIGSISNSGDQNITGEPLLTAMKAFKDKLPEYRKIILAL